MSLQGLQPEVLEINRITGIFDDSNIVSNWSPEVMLVILLLKKTKYNEIIIIQIMIMIMIVFIYNKNNKIKKCILFLTNKHNIFLLYKIYYNEIKY